MQNRHGRPSCRERIHPRAPIAGDVFLRALAEHGVDFFFANPGTDFPPVVEAFSRGRAGNAKLPRAVPVPHENLAVAMAHGAYLMTDRPPAVMVHVNVGTANTINNLINRARDAVTNDGRPGAAQRRMSVLIGGFFIRRPLQPT